MRRSRSASFVVVALGGCLIACLAGCAAVPRRQDAPRTNPRALTAKSRSAARAGHRDRAAKHSPKLSAKILPALEKTGHTLLELLLPIPSGKEPSWTSQARADCIVHVVSQWCTAFHLQ